MTSGEIMQEHHGRLQAESSTIDVQRHGDSTTVSPRHRVAENQGESVPEKTGGSSVAAPRRSGTASTRELGLDLALIVTNYLFQTDHLHYGYWPGDLAPTIGNLRRAQENYAEFVAGRIPAGVRTVLDVGTGTGALAHRLIGAGYEVDCVSPSPYLTERARTLLGDGPQIFECRYEDLDTEKRYDLVLFSESFQYIPLKKSLSISCARLEPHGHLLLCDFFRKDTPDDGPMGGGHPLKELHRVAAGYPLRLLVDEDITEQTAPNLDLAADFAQRVMAPARDRIFDCLSQRHPLAFRFVRWAFRKHLRRAEEKYFSGRRCGESFRAYKTYRLLLFQECRHALDSI